jgi:hypothetical protein
VAFASSASDLVGGDTNGASDVFVRDRARGITRRVSISSTGLQANDHSVEPFISADGEFVAFTSLATNLVLGDTNATWDVFLHELASAQTVRVSVSAGVSQGNAYSGAPASNLYADVVAFASAASSLVAGDTNDAADIFLHDLGFSLPASFCTAKVNSQGCTTHLLAVGTSSAPCTLEAVNELNNQIGILHYSTAGTAEIQLLGGLLCVQSPFVRTPGQFSGGAPPPVLDCSGSYDFDLKSTIQSASDPQLVSGQFLCAQVWSPDPGFAPPNGANLTYGIALLIAP